jgi:hypothetical protein
LGFFEYLLKEAPEWLCHLSPRHCELTLSLATSWWVYGTAKHTLTIQNLSKSSLFLDQEALEEHEYDDLAEGGTLSFSAVVHGRQQKYLQFVFRKYDKAKDRDAVCC